MGLHIMKERVVLDKVKHIISDEFGIVVTDRKSTFRFLELNDEDCFLFADRLHQEFGVEYVDFDGLDTLGDLVDLLMKG